MSETNGTVQQDLPNTTPVDDERPSASTAADFISDEQSGEVTFDPGALVSDPAPVGSADDDLIAEAERRLAEIEREQAELSGGAQDDARPAFGRPSTTPRPTRTEGTSTTRGDYITREQLEEMLRQRASGSQALDIEYDPENPQGFVNSLYGRMSQDMARMLQQQEQRLRAEYEQRVQQEAYQNAIRRVDSTADKLMDRYGEADREAVDGALLSFMHRQNREPTTDEIERIVRTNHLRNEQRILQRQVERVRSAREARTATAGAVRPQSGSARYATFIERVRSKGPTTPDEARAAAMAGSRFIADGDD